ncbi:MAG: peptidoglycan-associated lipoprotein Pal [Nitrospirota bacterium]|nr:peptidoglycan-associated lipoprotein Pal [Nitrospirota bacterium]
MRSRGLAAVFTVACLFAFVLTGCQKRVVTQPDAAQQQQPQGQQQKDQEKVTEKKLDAKVEAVDVKDKGQQYAESKESMFSDILFDYDKYDVKETYKQTLQSVSSWMAKNSTARLSIEGHCDERGTNEYNLALGDRRAKSVKDYLVSLGVASGRIDVISYGEEKPACKEQTDDCWAKNRRAHFTVLTKVGK